jgi:hypothetical protein
MLRQKQAYIYLQVFICLRKIHQTWLSDFSGTDRQTYIYICNISMDYAKRYQSKINMVLPAPMD